MSARLFLNSYKPNLNDPRVQQRIKDVLKWCDCLRGEKRAKAINSGVLRKVFGNTSQPFGGWLRSNLLMQTGSYAVGKQSYCYQLNEVGYEKLCAMISVNARTSSESVAELYGPIIRGEKLPEYNDNGGRRYHPIQNIRREVRKDAFEGWGWWDYDIDACAATLISQYAANYYRKVYPDIDVDNPFPAVTRLVEEKMAIRQHIITLIGGDLALSKEVIQSLFFMAPLAPHSNCAVYRLVGQDRMRFQRLKSDAYVKLLIQDIRKMWRFAVWADTRDRLAPIFSGKEPLPVSPSSAKRRHAIYIGLERKVMDAVHDWFGPGPFPGLLIHDGFLSRRDLNISDIETHVEKTTGYKIVLKKEKVSR